MLHSIDPQAAMRAILTPVADQGHQFDDWRLEECIREGGSGSLWLATNVKTGTQGHLKALQTFAQDIESFANAVDALESAQHPALPALLGSGGDDEHIYAVAEILTGDTLATRIAKGAMAPREAVQTFLTIAGALKTAHASGIAHRKLNREAIVFTATGPKLNGLAMHLDDHRTAEAAIPKDIEELGMLLFEALTGTEIDILDEKVAVYDPGPGVHPNLREVVLVATHPFPTERYEDIGAFITALKLAESAGAGSAVGGVLKWGAVLGVVLLLGGGIFLAASTGLVASLLAVDLTQLAPQPTQSGTTPPVADAVPTGTPDVPVVDTPSPDLPAPPPPPPPPPPNPNADTPPDVPSNVTEPEPAGTTVAMYFHSAPEGARVFVDGREIGVTPIRSVPLTVGRHKIRMTRPDGVEVKQTIKVGKRQYVRYIWRNGVKIEGFQ